MPVPEQIPHITYTTDGRTTDFPLTFECPDQSHLIIALDDVEPAVGQWSLLHNSVVFLTAPASNQTLSIERNTPLERTRTYKTNDNSFRPTALNKDFDYIWRKLQELGYKDSVLLRMIIKEIADRKYGDSVLTARLAAEEVARLNKDNDLQRQINSSAKKLQGQIASNTIDINELYLRLSKEILSRIAGDREAKRYAKDYVDFMMTKESEDMPIFSGVADNIVITENGDTQRDVNRQTVTTVESVAELAKIDTWDGRTVNVQNVGVFSFDASSNTWQQLSQKAKIGFDIEDWLKNTIITPDLFLKQAGGDDLKAFYLACDKANSLNLPVTLLPRTYELSDSIDLRKASCGITTSSERFSATTLKAIANTSNASTFVNYQNMDRTKLCSFRVDANSLYDIGIDSSYTLQVGPSLNITFETIWVKGYNKIGWLAENNSDVYFKSCAVFEPGTKSDKTVISIRCVTIGGPAQFECCNFLGGKQQVAAQHITNIMCVLSGIEFLKGSWNNYSAVGTHHFADLATNSCFTITGELWGFDVSGGLCEASDDGYLFSGNGGNTVTGKLQFNGTKITPNTGKMYLDRGTLGLKYGNLIASFNGGMQGLTGLDSLKIFDDVSLNSTNNTVSAISKDVVMSASAYRNYRTERSNLFSRTYTQRNDSSLVNVSPIYGTLSSNGGYYGVIDILSNKVAAGILNVISDDKRKSAQYRINNLLDANGNVVFNIVEVSNLSTTSNKFTVYYADNNLHVILSRDFPDDKTIKNVDYSFSGFITNT